MIIVDTCVWISLLDKDDRNYFRAKKILLDRENSQVEIFDHVYCETLNVLRNKLSEQYCSLFTQLIYSLKRPINITSLKILALANTYFFLNKKLSFTDCLIMATAVQSKAELITFDKNLQEAWNKVKN